MARKSSKRSRLPTWLRRTRTFAIANLFLWGGLLFWFAVQPIERREEVTHLLRNAVGGGKKITAFEVAWDLWQLYYGRDFVTAVAEGDKTHVYGGLPRQANGGPAGRVLVNSGYVVGYSDALGNPLWAAYRMNDAHVRDAAPRPDAFMVDSRTLARIAPDVYNRSGYDRGHLAPNHAIAIRYGPQAQEETFLMSNIAPQRHGLNAGLWKQLEQRIATNYPGRFREVWVIAGPVFGARPTRLARRVAIPEAFFMIVVDENEGRVRTAAFLLPQDLPDGATLPDYLVSIDEIEMRTGLDFLHELPDAAEALLEAKKIERVW